MLNRDKLIEYALTKHGIRIQKDDPIVSICVFHEAVMEEYRKKFKDDVLELDRRIDVVTQSYRDCAQEYAEDVLEKSLDKIMNRAFEQKSLLEDAFAKSVGRVDSSIQRLGVRLDKIEQELLYAKLFAVGSGLIFLAICLSVYVRV